MVWIQLYFIQEKKLGVLDLRSSGNYKIKQDILQQTLANITDMSQQTLCVNNLINI